jgi:hypothetical protein
MVVDVEAAAVEVSTVIRFYCNGSVMDWAYCAACNIAS